MINIKLGNKTLSVGKIGLSLLGLVIVAVSVTLYNSISKTEIYSTKDFMLAKAPQIETVACGNKKINPKTQGCCAEKVYNLGNQVCLQNCQSNPLEEILTKDLKVGSSGSDVIELQNFLMKKGYLVMPAGAIAGYFGGLTKTALTNYQISEGIVEPVNGYGYFGLSTRMRVISNNYIDSGISECRLTTGEIAEKNKTNSEKIEESAISEAFAKIASLTNSKKSAPRDCETYKNRLPNSFYRMLNSSILDNDLDEDWQKRIDDLPEMRYLLSDIKQKTQNIYDLANELIPLTVDAMLCACMPPEFIEILESDIINEIENGISEVENWDSLNLAGKSALFAKMDLAESQVKSKIRDLKRLKPDCQRAQKQCPFPHTHGH